MDVSLQGKHSWTRGIGFDIREKHLSFFHQGGGTFTDSAGCCFVNTITRLRGWASVKEQPIRFWYGSPSLSLK